MKLELDIWLLTEVCKEKNTKWKAKQEEGWVSRPSGYPKAVPAGGSYSFL